MFWTKAVQDRLLSTTCIFVAAMALLGCAQDKGFAPEDPVRLDSLSFAAPKALTLDDRSAARLIVARRFAQEVPTTVTFSKGSSDLDTESQDALAAQAEFMRAYPEIVFFVVGHTDPSGTATHNRILAQKRAERVAAHLIKLGVPDSQMADPYTLADQDPRFAMGTSIDRRAVTEVADFSTTNIPSHNDLASRPL